MLAERRLRVGLPFKFAVQWWKSRHSVVTMDIPRLRAITVDAEYTQEIVVHGNYRKKMGRQSLHAGLKTCLHSINLAVQQLIEESIWYIQKVASLILICTASNLLVG